MTRKTSHARRPTKMTNPMRCVQMLTVSLWKLKLSDILTVSFVDKLPFMNTVLIYLAK